MHRLATVSFLTLILLVARAESKASVGVSSVAPGCEGYWDPFSGKHHCSPQPKGAAKPRSAYQPPISTPPTRHDHPTSVASVSNPMQGAGMGTKPAIVAESGTSRPTSSAKEAFPKAGIKLGDGAVGTVSKDRIAQPSDSAREPTDAPPVVDRKEEGQVDQRGLESGSAKQQNTKNGNGEEENGGKGRGSGDHATGPDRGSVTQGVVSGSGQGSAQGVETVAGQPVKNKEDDIPGEKVKGSGSSHVASAPERGNTLEMLTNNGDQQKSGESNAQGESSGSCKGRAVILPVILILMYS